MTKRMHTALFFLKTSKQLIVKPKNIKPFRSYGGCETWGLANIFTYKALKKIKHWNHLPTELHLVPSNPVEQLHTGSLPVVVMHDPPFKQYGSPSSWHCSSHLKNKTNLLWKRGKSLTYTLACWKQRQVSIQSRSNYFFQRSFSSEGHQAASP